MNSNIVTGSQDAYRKLLECCLACTLQVKTMIIKFQFKYVGLYGVTSAGEALDWTHIHIAVGQWIRERYINHLFLLKLGSRPVLFQSRLHSH